MIEAIDNYKVKGIETTLAFGKYVCQHDAFISGNFTTHFVSNYYTPEIREEFYKNEAEIAAKIALQLYVKESQLVKLPKVKTMAAIKTLFNK